MNGFVWGYVIAFFVLAFYYERKGIKHPLLGSCLTMLLVAILLFVLVFSGE